MTAVVSGAQEGVAEPPREHSLRESYWGPLAAALLVAVAYYAGAKLGLALTFTPHPIPFVWPPNSILLAALLLVPWRWWWLVLAAAFPAHLLAELQGGVPPGDGAVLVREQRVRGGDRGGIRPHFRAGAVHAGQPAQRRYFHGRRRVYWGRSCPRFSTRRS